MTEEPTRSRLGRGLAALIGDVGEPTIPLERPNAARTVPTEFLRPNPKNPRKAFFFHEVMMASPKDLTPSNVSSVSKSLLPIAGRLSLIAKALSRVDLPDPFSPTKTVTGVSNDMLSNSLNACKVNGNWV